MGEKKTSELNEKRIFLSPIRETLKTEGKLFYSEGDQAWTNLRFKKEIIRKFPSLKDKDGNFIYQMELCDSFQELRRTIDFLEKTSKTVPIILRIAKSDKKEF